jgi:FAD/FMN-containing dehydrogenase
VALPETSPDFSMRHPNRAWTPRNRVCAADRDWVRSFWEALRPYATGSGSYVNFMAEIEEDRVRAAYGAEKYDRLARIKAEYDPNNILRLNANIQPARLEKEQRS